MPDLDRANAETEEFVLDVMADYRSDLIDAEVTVDILIDHDPLKLHGYVCAAVIKATPYRQRVKGAKDLELTIDERQWKELGTDERRALIHHEFLHPEFVFDKEGQIRSDKIGRPCMKMKLHDVQIGWFLDIAQRHGAASFEVKQARQIREDHGQLLFDWTDDMAGQTEAEQTAAGTVAFRKGVAK